MKGDQHAYSGDVTAFLTVLPCTLIEPIRSHTMGRIETWIPNSSE